MVRPKQIKKKKFKRLKNKLARVPKVFKRALATEEKVSEAIKAAPRITNETVIEHREAILSGARRFIYPLQHSKHSIVRTSSSILGVALIIFLVYTGLALYRYQGTSGFVYGVVKVLPLPVAKAGSSWISYESYLFELRRNMHYYQTQQAADFSTKEGKSQLTALKTQAMKQVILNSYVDQLASENRVSVSNLEVDNLVTLLRNQNRLGSITSPKVFEDVLNEFWGWSQADFKRELKMQLLQQAVVTKLDTVSSSKAAAALKQLNAGADFATVAAQASDDAATKSNGGQYPSVISVNDPNLSPVITSELFKLKAGKYSSVIPAGYTLEILKSITNDKTTVTGAHIQFNLQSINAYVGPYSQKYPSSQYIKF